MKDEAATSTLKPVVDEFGVTASNSQDKANLFANRLQRIHQEPDYRGFNNEWKEQVEQYLRDNEEAFVTKMEESYLEEEVGDNSNLVTEVKLDELEETLQKCKNRSAACLVSGKF